MSEMLAELYPRDVLARARRPRNRREVARCSHMAHSDNPVCGDEMTVYLKIGRRGEIRDAAFSGRSCAIATASASLMTEAIIGKTAAQARELSERFRAIACGERPPEAGDGAMAAFAALHQSPVRIKCAGLAWQTMTAALETPKEAKMNIDRTVLVFAGAMILASLVLSQLYSPYWLLLTAWIGVVMFQSGFTRACPAAALFRKLGIKPGAAFR